MLLVVRIAREACWTAADSTHHMSALHSSVRGSRSLRLIDASDTGRAGRDM